MIRKNTCWCLFALAGLLLALVSACNSAATPAVVPTSTPVMMEPPLTLPATTLTPTDIPVLSEDTLKNAMYASLDAEPPDYQGGDTMQLTAGSYTLKDPNDALPDYQVTYVQSASGDLNGDGAPDAAVVLAANPGGSGTFFYLLPAINQDGKVVNSSSTFLGDRVQIQSLTITAGEVHLTMLTAGPEDPMCCPSLQVDQEYVLSKDSLVSLVQTQVTP